MVAMPLVPENYKEAVWNTLLGVDWNYRYYMKMSDRCHNRAWFLRCAVLSSVLIEAGVLYGTREFSWMLYIAIGLGAILAVLAVVDATSHYAEDAVWYRVTAFACDDLKAEAEELWTDISSNQVDFSEVQSRHRSIVQQWLRATQRVKSRTDDKVAEQTQRASYWDVRDRYATE